jgi:hypothetical protein
MRKALIVGIDNYPNAPLRGCVNDANDIAILLETNADGSPNFSIKITTDVVIKSKLKELIVDLFDGKNDVALFYYSGHGFINEIGGYIVTPDYKKYDEGISMDEILVLVNKSHSADKIVILDCCHSGAFGSPSISGNSTTHIAEGVTILTASRDAQSAVEINGHGIFTSLLIDSLQGGAADLRGHVTPGSVYAYIDRALGPWDQRPVFKTNVTRFTSLRTTTPPIPIDLLRKIINLFSTPESVISLDPSFEFTEKTANPSNVAIFKILQKYERVGLVIPIGEEHMYFAVVNSKSCKLTTLGQHYWRLVKDKRI